MKHKTLALSSATPDQRRLDGAELLAGAGLPLPPIGEWR
jgi:hypothetical protein